jgi:hypothetical protein
MNLTDAARMILAETAALPNLTRVSRCVCDESSAGRTVRHTTLRWMLREAGLEGVFNLIDNKYGGNVVRDMIRLIEREIDRSALAAYR